MNDRFSHYCGTYEYLLKEHCLDRSAIERSEINTYASVNDFYNKPLLAVMQEKYGLQYETVATAIAINATGSKPHYYSRNTKAADFGYLPSRTSLEGLIKEMNAILLVDKLNHTDFSPVTEV
jgi:hypothetical protein